MFKSLTPLAAATAALTLSTTMEARAATDGSSPYLASTSAAPGKVKAPRTVFAGDYGRGWCFWHPYRCYREDDDSSSSDDEE